MINYATFQNQAKTTLQNFGAVSVNVRLLNNTVISTIGVFSKGLAKNIDDLQNPTSLTGETDRYVYVPGIDFVIAGQTNTPQVSGTVEWYVNAVLYKKIISSVAMIIPIPNTPILFTLGIQ